MLISILLLFTILMPLDNKTNTWFNFGGGVNLTTLFLLLLLLFWIMKRNNTNVFITNPLNMPIILFISAVTFSLFTLYVQLGLSPFDSTIHFYKRFITIFIVYFIILNISNSKKIMKILIYTMVSMILIIGILAIKEYRAQGRWHYDNDIRFMIAGMQPNHLGAFFAQYTPLLLSLILLGRKFSQKILLLIPFFTSTSALMYTYSRGAYLSLMCAIVVMCLFAKKRDVMIMGSIIIIAILANSLLFGKGRIIPVSVRERFESIAAEEKDRSIEGREVAWAIAKDYINQSPIIGYGYGASRHMLPLDTHNMYLDIALEAGIPTLLILIWIFITIYWVAIRTFRRTEDHFCKALSLGLIGSVTAVIIGNIFGTRLNFFASNGYFVILLGLVARINSDMNMNRKIALAKNKAKHKKLALAQ